jgi:hypothetical protein
MGWMDGSLGLNIFICYYCGEKERVCGEGALSKEERKKERKKDCMVMGGRSCYIEDSEGWMLCSALLVLLEVRNVKCLEALNDFLSVEQFHLKHDWRMIRPWRTQSHFNTIRCSLLEQHALDNFQLSTNLT